MEDNAEQRRPMQNQAQGIDMALKKISGKRYAAGRHLEKYAMQAQKSQRKTPLFSSPAAAPEMDGDIVQKIL